MAKATAEFTDDAVLAMMRRFMEAGFEDTAMKYWDGQLGGTAVERQANSRRCRAMGDRAKELLREMRSRLAASAGS